MKTQAFLIRVAICFLLSLIPLSELENRIYSARMELRGHRATPTNLLILNAEPDRLEQAETFRALQSKLLASEPALVLLVDSHSPMELTLDGDGEVRRSAMVTKGQGTLAYRAYMALSDSKALKSPTQAHLINYLGPAGSIPSCQAVWFEGVPTVQGCPDLKGKIILVNGIHEDTYLFRTPLGEMSRTEIIANDIHTVINRDWIYFASIYEVALLSLMMILIAAFYIIYYPVIVSAVAITGIGAIFLLALVQIAFHLFGIYIPSSNVLFALLLTYLVFTGYRLAFQENLQWRSLKQAQYLRELDQMKTNFVSLVSHDLKTPLAKIQANVERMRRELGQPLESRSDWKELLESIDNSNNELKHYILSILNLSKIESQKVILNKRTNDINFLIGQTLKRLRPLAQQKGIIIEEQLEPLFSIEFDEDLIRQVLTNLIDNAIKYSPSGSKVIVRSHEEDGSVQVDVEDFGPGIPKDQLPLMFRKFSRFMKPMGEQVKGTGLGLYLSKYFMELHGGSIRLTTVEGRGTTFTVRLPLEVEKPGTGLSPFERRADAPQRHGPAPRS